MNAAAAQLLHDVQGLKGDAIKRKLFEYCVSIIFNNDPDGPESFHRMEAQVTNCTYMFMDNLTEVNDILEEDEHVTRAPIQRTEEQKYLWFELSNVLWWYLTVLSTVSLVLYGYYLKDMVWKKKIFKQPILSAIIGSDFIMLVFFVFGVVMGGNIHGTGGRWTCKFIMFTTNSSAFFTNWCWVILWVHKYIAIYHPLKHLRHRHRGVKVALVVLMLVACGCEFWTLLLASQKTVDGVTYCDVDLGKSHHWIFSWVALAEVGASFFLPFAIILAADIAVLYKAYSPTIIMQVTIEELRAKRSTSLKRKRYSSCPPLESESEPQDRNAGRRANYRILPPLYRERQLRRKMQSIIRCTVTGSLDLLLNLPLYTFEIADNFLSFKKNYSDQWAIVGSIVYMLYFLQFPLIIFYVRHVLNEKTKVQKLSQSQQSDGIMQRKLVMAHFNDDISVVADSQARTVKARVTRERSQSLLDEQSRLLHQSMPMVVVKFVERETTVICSPDDIDLHTSTDTQITNDVRTY